MEKYKKYIKYIKSISKTVELIAAVLVIVAIFIAIVGVVKDFFDVKALLMLDNTNYFKHYLEEIFVIVIGIEFVGMLCHPDSDNVLELLIFLVARHMIIGDTTSFEDFISVISIGILCVLRKYLHNSNNKHEELEDNN